MPSLIPDYEYDIFISYRQKDNKYDGWVSEFVANLRKELVATFKEDVSIYFDVNPHDGLLETYHVDKSLEGKLKCLIFIPIISQTYCDPKSFAWQHELCLFNKMVREDQFGRDIRLSNGNVASRILPIKIHDLDAEDKTLLENELGGVLRAIEFIYKEAGVNRPLKPSDNKNDNQNRIDYRNQVNKVANAIKEIISSLKNPSLISKPRADNRQSITDSQTFSKLKKGIIASLVLIMLATAGYFLYAPLFSSGKKDELDKSIAVLPFADMSPGKDQEYFSDGLSEELLNRLAKIPALKVIGRTSSFSFKGKNEDLRQIADKLGVAHILEGSVRKSNNKVRITAQLIKASDGSQLWSETYDREIEDILQVQEEISKAVVDRLQATLLKNTKQENVILNKEAYDLFLKGNYFYSLGGKENWEKAHHSYSEGLVYDSANAQLLAALANVLEAKVIGGYIDPKVGIRQAKQAAQKAIAINQDVAEGHIMLGHIYAYYEYDWERASQEIEKAFALAPGNVQVVIVAATFASETNDHKKAIELYNQAIELDPVRNATYHTFGVYLFNNSRFPEARRQLRKAIELNPTRYYTYSWIACSYLLENQLDSALFFINKESDAIRKEIVLPIVLYALGRVNESDARLENAINKYRNLQAQFLAMNYALRVDSKMALDLLEQAYKNQEYGIHHIRNTPMFKNIRQHPRFIALLRKMNMAADVK